MVPEKGVDLDVMRSDEVGKTPFLEEKVGEVLSSTMCLAALLTPSRNSLSTRMLSTATTLPAR